MLEVLRSGQLGARPDAARASRRPSRPSSARATPSPSRAAPPACTWPCALAGVGAGDEVVTSPISFVASANCDRSTSAATPVFADIDPDTFNLDPAAVEAAITPRTKAIVPVHIFGLPVPRSRRSTRSRRGTGWRSSRTPRGASARAAAGRLIGTHGNPAVFAFYPNKQMTTGEGGMVTTDDDDARRRPAPPRQPGPRATPATGSSTTAWASTTAWTTLGRHRPRPGRAPRRDPRRARRGRRALRPRCCGGAGRRDAAGAGGDGDVRSLVRLRRAASTAAIDRDAVMAALGERGRAGQAVPAGHPPAAVLPRARPSRGRAAGRARRSRAARSRCRSTRGSRRTTPSTWPPRSPRCSSGADGGAAAGGARADRRLELELPARAGALRAGHRLARVPGREGAHARRGLPPQRRPPRRQRRPRQDPPRRLRGRLRRRAGLRHGRRARRRPATTPSSPCAPRPAAATWRAAGPAARCRAACSCGGRAASRCPTSTPRAARARSGRRTARCCERSTDDPAAPEVKLAPASATGGRVFQLARSSDAVAWVGRGPGGTSLLSLRADGATATPLLQEARPGWTLGSLALLPGGRVAVVRLRNANGQRRAVLSLVEPDGSSRVLTSSSPLRGGGSYAPRVTAAGNVVAFRRRVRTRRGFEDRLMAIDTVSRRALRGRARAALGGAPRRPVAGRRAHGVDAHGAALAQLRALGGLRRLAAARLRRGPRAAVSAPLDAAFFARSVHVVAPELIGATLLLDGVGGHRRRGRGLRPRRSRLALLPRADAAQRHHVRAGRPCLRLPLLRRALDAQPGLRRARGRRRGRARAGAGAGARRRADARAARRGGRRAALRRAGAPGAGARPDAASTTASRWRAGASSCAPREVAPEIATGPRIGISQAVERPWRYAAAGCALVSRPYPWHRARAGRRPAGAPRGA